MRRSFSVCRTYYRSINKAIFPPVAGTNESILMVLRSGFVYDLLQV